MKTALNSKTIEILIYLSYNRLFHISKLNREFDLGYSYFWTKLSRLEKQGLIYFKDSSKDKRLKIPRLTEKGVEVVRLLNKIKELVE